MKLSELSVRRPVLITMTYILILIIAALFVTDLDIALYPSVESPVLTVLVDCDDAGPEEIEQQVSKVLENALNSIEGLEEMTSRSSSGQSMVMLEFAYGTDLDDAMDSVNTLLNRVNRQLPDWADTPEVMRFDMSSSSEFMQMVISGSQDKQELQDIAENIVSPLLLRIDGVSQVDVRGSSSKQYTVSVDPIRLAAYDLTLSTVESALASRNVQGTGGTITQGDIDYTVSIDERYTSLEQIRKTVLATIDGVSVLLEDVASVAEDASEGFYERYLDGTEVVTLSLSNDSDSNAATVAEAVTEQLDGINEELPEGVRLSIQRDSTTMVSSTLNEVYKSALTGVILAALVIFLFLRNLKATLVISLSMPISILITLMVLSFFGISVNSMSMSGLILGIGMIVDASIIILENSYRYREKGYGSAASAILGSENMGSAILSSTLTTICVFIPLLIFKNRLEMIGIMFQDLIITVCIAMIVSLFVSVTLVPALSGSILRIDSRVQKPLRSAFLQWIDGICVRIEMWLENVYAKILGYFLGRRFLLILLLVLLLVFSLQHFSGIGMSLTPSMDSDDSVSLSLTLPAGTNKSVTRSELFALQAKLMETLPEGAYTQMMVEVGTTNTGSLEISLPDLRDQAYSANEVKNLVRPLLEDNPEATWTFGASRGPQSSSAINISITGDDTSAIREAANSIAAIIGSYVPEAINVSTDLEDGSPKVNILIDKEIADDLGVSMETVYSTVDQALSGTTATSISTFNSETTYDLIVKMAEDSLQTIDDLGSLLVATDGGTVRLDSLATFAYSAAPSTITRENKQQVNHVTASLAEGYSASEVQELVQRALDEYLLLPDGVEVSQQGDMQQFTSYGPTLVLIILLAVLLVFAVMAAQFESLVDPFIIFATIPLLLIGVVSIHLLWNQSFTLFSIVGIIALIGVVVNNGIVLVDSINRLVAAKTPVLEACLTAARSRLRPILMTTLTTILGMVPLAFFPGEGAEMMQPIALTFVGGLATGAFLTLFLSPCLYSIFNRRREKKYDDPNTLANQLALFDLEGR